MKHLKLFESYLDLEMEKLKVYVFKTWEEQNRFLTQESLSLSQMVKEWYFGGYHDTNETIRIVFFIKYKTYEIPKPKLSFFQVRLNKFNLEVSEEEYLVITKDNYRIESSAVPANKMVSQILESPEFLEAIVNLAYESLIGEDLSRTSELYGGLSLPYFDALVQKKIDGDQELIKKWKACKLLAKRR